MSTETTETQQLATRPAKQPIPAGDRGVRLESLSAICKFAEMAVNSGLYRDIKDNPSLAVIKIQAGLELGLSPVWALTNIYVVNGKPCVFGDALLGIVLAQPLCEDVIETSEGVFPNDTYTAVCEVRRRGRLPVIRRFSVADAKKAGIFGKNVHASYPTRMLAMRARSWACRDAFADALQGLAVKEEQENLGEVKQVKVREIADNLQLPDEEPPVAADQDGATLDPKNEKGEFIF